MAQAKAAPRGFVPPPAPESSLFVPPAAAGERKKRVTLESVVRGRTTKPPRVMIYGTGGLAWGSALIRL